MPSKLLALDVGVARIGLAIANDIARIAAPLPALPNDERFPAALKALIDEQGVTSLIVGYPRGLEGQETEQTRYVDQFIKALEQVVEIPVKRQDEAVTSVLAEAELQRRPGTYAKEEIDGLSAVYILEDFLNEGVN